MVAAVASSSTRAASNISRARAMASSETWMPLCAPNAPSRRLTAAPSPSYRSYSRRSKLLATWMSMLGLMVGSTSPALYVPLLKNRARMSLRLVATISCAIGSPILYAT